MQSVVAGDGALAGVMGKAAQLGALVQGHDGVGTQSAKAHGRHIEQAHGIRLGALVATHRNAKVMALNLAGGDGVGQPLIAQGAQIELGAKRPFVRLPLGPCVNQRALRTRKGRCVGFAF